MNLRAVFLVALLVFLCGCQEEEQKFNLRETNLSYAEFVRETPVSFEEYIVLSNGLMLSKSHDGTTQISVGLIDPSLAEMIIRHAKENITAANNGLDCTHCSIYHIFYGSPSETLTYSVLEDNTTESITDLLETTRAANTQLEPQPLFFVHFVYKKPGEDTYDFHLYSDGTVLFEEFGPRNGELKKAKIYRISQEDVLFLRESVTPDFFGSEEGLEGCIEKGFEWGYIEVAQGPGYNQAYVCGAGETPADELFNRISGRLIP